MEDLGGAEDPVLRPGVQDLIDKLKQTGMQIEHFGTGRVDNYSDEGYGLIWNDARYPGDDEGDFFAQDLVDISDPALLSIGHVFDYVAYNKNGQTHFVLLMRQPREWTPEERAEIDAKSAKYLEMIDERPTGPII